MRREEIDRLPDGIAWSAVQEMLVSLGLVPADVAAVHMYPRHVEVEVFATDEKGHKFADGNNEIAMYSISLKVEYDR